MFAEGNSLPLSQIMPLNPSLYVKITTKKPNLTPKNNYPNFIISSSPSMNNTILKIRVSKTTKSVAIILFILDRFSSIATLSSKN